MNATTADEHALAAFLLGYPSFGDITVATANDFYIDYYGGYVQDDFRINSDLTVNLGLRYEFEQGLQEKTNSFTVGFDRDRPWPFQIPGGPPLKGGLQYAGVDGYPTHQSDPSKTKFAPRAGFAWSINPRTVVRGGYGLFWAPYQYAFPTDNNLGARGFTQVTDYVASTDEGLTPCPTCSIVNPFPNGFDDPTGSAFGLLTGAGGSVNFVDQFRKSPYVHQYSLDLQRELPGNVVAGIGYIGARTERLGVGGTTSATVNINQLDPRFQALGAALLRPGAQPVLRGPALRRLLGVTDDLPRAAAAAVPAVRRPAGPPGERRQDPLPLGRPQAGAPDRGRLGRPGELHLELEQGQPLRRGQRLQQPGGGEAVDNYDLEAEYADSLLHAPHRLNVSGTVELPFGKGKSRLSEPGLARTLFGGWSITVVGFYQSGFPVNVIQNTNNSGLFGSNQRPNLTGTDPATSGSTESHYDPSCGCIDELVQPGRLDAGPGLHLRQRAAHRHPPAHAVPDRDRRGVPEGRAAGRRQDADGPVRDDQHPEPASVQRAQHDLRLFELRPHHGDARLPAVAATDGAVRVLAHASAARSGGRHRAVPFVGLETHWSSMTRKVTPSTSSTSWMTAMLGCLREAAAFAS